MKIENKYTDFKFYLIIFLIGILLGIIITIMFI